MMSDKTADVNVEQFANETVRLTAAITRVMNAPDILTGEVSGSGKTIAVEHPNREGKTFRLETETIMNGDSEFRDSWSFSLYTREDFQNTQKANHGPGPQAGANGVTDAADLPEPTHTPVGEEPEDEGSEDDDPDGDVSSDADPEGEDGQKAVADGGEEQRDRCGNCGIELIQMSELDEAHGEDKIRLRHRTDGGIYCEACAFRAPDFGEYEQAGSDIVETPEYRADGGEGADAEVECSRCGGCGEVGPDIIDPADCSECGGTGTVPAQDARDAEGEPVSEGDEVTVMAGERTYRVETVHADGRVTLGDGRSMFPDIIHVSSEGEDSEDDHSNRVERDSDGTHRCDECHRQVAAYAPTDHAPDCSRAPGGEACQREFGDGQELATDGGEDVFDYSPLFAAACDRYGSESVTDRTYDAVEMFGFTGELADGTYKFQVSFDTEVSAGQARDELEPLGYDVFLKPDGRFSGGVDPCTLIVVPTEDAEAVEDTDTATDGGQKAMTDGGEDVTDGDTAEELWNVVGQDTGGEYELTVEYDSLRSGSSRTVSGEFREVSGTPFSGGYVELVEDDGGTIRVSHTGMVYRTTTGANLGDLTGFSANTRRTDGGGDGEGVDSEPPLSEYELTEDAHTYNTLKSIAADHGVDVDANASKRDVVNALRDARDKRTGGEPRTDVSEDVDSEPPGKWDRPYTNMDSDGPGRVLRDDVLDILADHGGAYIALDTNNGPKVVHVPEDADVISHGRLLNVTDRSDGYNRQNISPTFVTAVAGSRGELARALREFGDDPARYGLDSGGETRADGGEWDPEPATLREDEPEDTGHARRNAEQLAMARRQGFNSGEDPDDEGSNPGGEPMTDGGREPMNVSADEWEDMTLRFEAERNPRNLTEHPRVESDPTSFHALSIGDVVVVDVGKHTGPADWGGRRQTYFNKTAYRVTRNSGGDKVLNPSDGRASELRFSRRHGAHAGAVAVWAERRVSADAKAHRVLEPCEDEPEDGEPMTDGGQPRELPVQNLRNRLDTVEPGDTLTVTYRSRQSGNALTISGEVTEVKEPAGAVWWVDVTVDGEDRTIRVEDDGDVETVRRDGGTLTLGPVVEFQRDGVDEPTVMTDGGEDVDAADEPRTWYGTIQLDGVSEDDARWLMTGMEAMCEDSGALESKGIEQPEEWSVSGPESERHEKVRSVLQRYHSMGKRPRPATIAKRLGIELDGDFGGGSK